MAEVKAADCPDSGFGPVSCPCRAPSPRPARVTATTLKARVAQHVGHRDGGRSGRRGVTAALVGPRTSAIGDREFVRVMSESDGARCFPGPRRTRRSSVHGEGPKGVGKLSIVHSLHDLSAFSGSPNPSDPSHFPRTRASSRARCGTPASS